MTIREDSIIVLKTLFNWGTGPDDPKKGRYQIRGEDLTEATGLEPRKINNAVELLEDNDLVITVKVLRSRPYTFVALKLSAEGRVTAEELLIEKNEETEDKMTAVKQDYELFIDRILRADQITFPSVLNQLFTKLEQDAGKTEKYQYYEKARKKWENWPGGDGGSFGPTWQLPNEIEEMKTLAYDIYKSCAEQNEAGGGLLFTLFANRNLNVNIKKCNQTFFASPAFVVG